MTLIKLRGDKLSDYSEIEKKLLKFRRGIVKYIKMTMRYAHPTPENKRRAVDVLATLFGGGSGKVADGQRGERTGAVSPVSEN